MKYAKIDSRNTNVQPVIGWFDSDVLKYNEDFTSSDFVEMTDAQWAVRTDNPYYDPSAKTFGSTPPPATLDETAASQIAAVRAAFTKASAAPVTSNGIQWNGGTQSASMLDGAVRLAQSSGASTVDLWDYTNTKHSLSISSAQAVVDAVAAAFQASYQRWQTLRAQVVSIQNTKTRANGTTYSAGDEVTDGNGNLWKCTTAGTSGSKKPTWPKSPTTSSTVTDGTVTWTYVSTLEAATQAVAW